MKKIIWIPSLCVIAAGFLIANYFSEGALWEKALAAWSKLYWKKFEGCVVAGEKNVNYEFMGKKSWDLVTPDMGCGRKYQDAESWGLLDKKMGENITDIAQFTVLVTDVKPTAYDTNAFEYLAIPGVSDQFIEIGRINATDTQSGESYGITDKEWQHLKNSFKSK